METSNDALQDQELHALIVEHAEQQVSQAIDSSRGDASQEHAAKTLPLEVDGGDTTATMTSRSFGELQLMDASAMALSVADLDHASDHFLASGLANAAAILDLSKLQPEVLQWMEQCRVANGGITASEDDVLYYFDTKYPELLQPEVNSRVFEWLHGFFSALANTVASMRFSREVKFMALRTLSDSPEATQTLVAELGLKSPTTLQFWKYEHAKFVASTATTTTTRATTTQQPPPPAVKRRSVFLHEKALVEWLLSHKHTPITNHDIVTHLQTHYPDFVQGRPTASVSVWVARFLKRNLPSESNGLLTGLSDHDDLGSASDGGKDTQDEDSQELGDGDGSNPRKRRPKRKSPNGYVLHSNEFKLNALKLLDEGKTISEVAEELGIKCPNTLVYWNSIRDKLAVADKKRFRLAGGGRRSTCTFEDELMSWVSDRHQKGLGTDVKAVLDYMREFHSTFTDGKKEPTLRKWILRFFKRWRQPSVSTGAAPDDELDKTTGILV